GKGTSMKRSRSRVEFGFFGKASRGLRGRKKGSFYFVAGGKRGHSTLLPSPTPPFTFYGPSRCKWWWVWRRPAGVAVRRGREARGRLVSGRLTVVTLNHLFGIV